MDKLKGIVKGGSGTDSQKSWDKVSEMLGREIYPGTFNVKMRKKFKFTGAPVAVPKSNFASLYVVPGKVNGEPCLIGKKKAGRSKKMLYLFSDVYLRDKLNVKDGDEVEIEETPELERVVKSGQAEQRHTERQEVEAEQAPEAEAEEIMLDEGIDYDDMNVIELRELAKAEGMTGIYGKNKAELIEALKG